MADFASPPPKDTSAMSATPKYALPTKSSKKEMATVQTAMGQHSFLVEEQEAFVEHVNACLAHDAYLKDHGYLPLRRDSDDLFRKMADGILLCKLINLAVPDTVDERALNFPTTGKQLNTWEMTENQNIAINSARGCGIQVVNIGAKDLINAADDHKEYLVLGLVWQLVKLQLMSGVSITEHPEIFRLLAEGEELADLLKLPPEETLLRWINFHLARAGETKRVTNFSDALKDGSVYLTLLHSIDPEKCPKDPSLVAADADPLARAHAVVENARALDVPVMVQPADIVSGNRKLNLAFVAQIFNTRHGLEVRAEERKEIEQAFEAVALTEEPEEDAREERVFRMWLNSLGLNDGSTFVRSMSEDLNDGLTLIDAILAVAGDTVALGARKVNRGDKLNQFKRVENCNLAVALGKELGLSLPGLGGVDIAAKNTKLILGFVWQLMRLQTLRVLRDVGHGTVPKDQDVCDWANEAVSRIGKEGTIRIGSFRDKAIASGVFLLDLLSTIEPRAINTALVTAGETPEEREKNAKYVISVARKLGATVFLTWEDIVDVKPKMIMTLVACIWQLALKKKAAE